MTSEGLRMTGRCFSAGRQSRSGGRWRESFEHVCELRQGGDARAIELDAGMIVDSDVVEQHAVETRLLRAADVRGVAVADECRLARLDAGAPERQLKNFRVRLLDSHEVRI